jgi:nucleoid DNA-binding protein
VESVEKYIVELLEQHDCVMVPDFGGFVLNRQSARFSGQATHELRPPARTISFNVNLGLNDGLLASYISRMAGKGYSEAQDSISLSVNHWKEALHESRFLNLGGIGKMQLSEDEKILFEPAVKNNFLLSSFGLTSLQLVPIDNVKPIAREISAGENAGRAAKNPRIVRRLVATAAAACLLMAGGLFGWQYYHPQPQPTAMQSGNTPTLNQETVRTLDNIISSPQQQAENTVSISNSKYYIIGGSFNSKKHADTFAKELETKGYKAEILGNENGFFRVAYKNDRDSLSADQYLQQIKTQENQEAWLLKW